MRRMLFGVNKVAYSSLGNLQRYPNATRNVRVARGNLTHAQHISHIGVRQATNRHAGGKFLVSPSTDIHSTNLLSARKVNLVHADDKREANEAQNKLLLPRAVVRKREKRADSSMSLEMRSDGRILEKNHSQKAVTSLYVQGKARSDTEVYSQPNIYQKEEYFKRYPQLPRSNSREDMELNTEHIYSNDSVIYDIPNRNLPIKKNPPKVHFSEDNKQQNISSSTVQTVNKRENAIKRYTLSAEGVYGEGEKSQDSSLYTEYTDASSDSKKNRQFISEDKKFKPHFVFRNESDIENDIPKKNKSNSAFVQENLDILEPLTPDEILERYFNSQIDGSRHNTLDLLENVKSELKKVRGLLEEGIDKYYTAFFQLSMDAREHMKTLSLDECSQIAISAIELQVYLSSYTSEHKKVSQALQDVEKTISKISSPQHVDDGIEESGEQAIARFYQVIDKALNAMQDTDSDLLKFMKESTLRIMGYQSIEASQKIVADILDDCQSQIGEDVKGTTRL